MDIDIYKLCPCQSGKKIKFCCAKDILSDLNQILNKNASGQSQAALDQIERVTQKSGHKDCLLTIKTHILITNDRIDEAEQTNNFFLEKNPKHSTGLHHRALILLAQDKIPDAVAMLQDAMDAITGNEIPISMASAFRMIGLGLIAHGQLVAGRMHIYYANQLKLGNDDELRQLLTETYRIPDVPLMLKADFTLTPPPDGVDWEDKYINVLRAMDRGQYRMGLRLLKYIDENFAEHELILRGIAMVNMYLGYQDEIAPAWRRASKAAGVSHQNAVEAEALAQLFEDCLPEDMLDILRLTFEITDVEQVNERMLSTPWLATVSGDNLEDPFDEGPAPRMFFHVLDKQQVGPDEEPTIENLPNLVGELFLYGKQTDRPARLEWLILEDDSFENLQQRFLDVFSDFISGDPQRQSIEKMPKASESLRWNWHLPKQMTNEKHLRLADEKFEQMLFERWSNTKLALFGNQSALEAAQDPKYVVAVAAALLLLQQSPAEHFFADSRAERLRTQLDLPAFEKIDPTSQAVDSLSILQQQQLEFEKLTDQQLLSLHTTASITGNIPVVRSVTLEILNRPEFTAIPRDICFSTLAQITADGDQMLEYLKQARREAKANGRSDGLYLVQEFELRLSRGLTEKLPDLFERIRSRYLDDPDVKYRMSQVLEKYGLLQGMMEQAPADVAAQPEPAAVAADTWPTAPPSQPEPGEEPSKLWIPD